MHVDRKVPLEIDQEWFNWSNNTLSIRDDTWYKVISLIRLKDEQKKRALNFFRDLNNQGREIFEHELKEAFSCESSAVRLLIQYVNTIITKGRILKKMKGWYIYHLEASKKSFPLRKRNAKKPKELLVSEYIYNILKENRGVWFTSKQLIEMLPESHFISQSLLRHQHIQKKCKLSVQQEIDDSSISQKGKKPKWSDDIPWKIPTKFKKNEKFIRYVIENQWKEISFSDLIKLLEFKKWTWLLHAIKAFQNRFSITGTFYNSKNGYICIPSLSTLQRQAIDNYLSSQE